MRYQIQQKMVSIGDDFRILDEDGNDIYFVDGYGFSFGNKLSFQDMQKEEKFLIKQSLFTFRPSYKFRKHGETLATVRKNLLSFRPTFVLTIPSSSRQIQIVGRVLEHEYFFREGSTTVATVSKRWFRATDTYAVDISEKGDHAVILAAVIVVDLVCHQRNSKYDRC